MFNRMMLAAVVLAGAGFHANAGYAKTFTNPEYEVTVIKDKGEFQGCLGTNGFAGIGILGVQNSVFAIFTSEDLNVSKGRQVIGTWSVDGNKAVPFKDDDTAKNTLTIELADKSQLSQLRDGDFVLVSVGKDEVKFDLTGFTKGFNAVAQCMDAKSP